MRDFQDTRNYASKEKNARTSVEKLDYDRAIKFLRKNLDILHPEK